MFNIKILIPISLIMVSCASVSANLIDKRVARFDIPEVKSCQNRFNEHVSYSTCLDGVISNKDRQLTTWTKNIEFKLQEVAAINGRKDSILVFRAANKEFITFKNKNCKWQYLAQLPDINAAAVMSKECQIYMTINHIENLMQLSQHNFI